MTKTDASKPKPTVNSAPRREDYACFFPQTTRWSDNDLYGHINNVQYYSYFDSAVNRFLISQGKLDIHQGDIVGFVVNSQCNYYSPLAYPDELEVGLRVNRIGTSSVEYGVAVFKRGHAEASAAGSFTHVFVNRENQRPKALSGGLLSALQSIVVA